jgi:hypothetical protein
LVGAKSDRVCKGRMIFRVGSLDGRSSRAIFLSARKLNIWDAR